MKDMNALDAEIGKVVAGVLENAREEACASSVALGEMFADLQAQVQILNDTFDGRAVAAVLEARRKGRL